MTFNALKETYSIDTTLPPNFKDFEIVGVAPLELATPNHLSYVDQKSYLKKLKDTKAGGCSSVPNMRAKSLPQAKR